MAERSEIQFGLTRIPFLIRRSAKRATVALTIENDGGLVVTAPSETPIDKLNAVVRHKAPWVVQRLRRISDLPPPRAVDDREFVTGETVLYLGRQLRLKVVETAEAHNPRMRSGWYEVPVAPGLEGEALRREVRRRLAGSLKEHADLYLQDRLAEVCRRARIEKPSLVVREQRRRWGSCDARGTVRINWRIVQAPIPLIEYVLAHELVHLAHRAHGPEFWATLGRMMPDYEERRRRLRALGPTLEW
jgi:predicted metal-dependent hydrolase